MIRASVTAIDVKLADTIATILVERLCPDVLQQSYQPPSHLYAAVRDPRSIVIDIDEGLTIGELLIMPANFRVDDQLLLISVSLKSQNIRVFRSYTLIERKAHQVIPLVHEFFRIFPGSGARASNAAQDSAHAPGATL
jgi:hypothetical protein